MAADRYDLSSIRWYKNWSDRQIDTLFSQVFTFAFNAGNVDKGIKKSIYEIQNLIGKTGVYCAFCYKDNKEVPRDVILLPLTQMRTNYM